MTNYNTHSGFGDLNGTMSVTDDNVDTYTSTTLGAATVHNLGGTGLSFNLSFSTPPKNYHINATPNNGGFSGSANNNGPDAGQDSWTATASTGDTATKKASY
ncbi:MAG: hypothetical protein ABI791_15140 [Acidobacteriota bacterium]